MSEPSLQSPDLSPPSQGARSRAKKVLYTALALALVAAGLYGVFLTNLLSAHTAPDSAAGERPAAGEGVSVQTVRPARANLRRTSTQPGTVHPFSEAKVYARVTGYLKELQADIGHQVEEGQVLGQIEVSELERKRDRLQAEVGRFQAEQTQAGAEVETARAQVAAYQAQVSQARAGLKKAQALLAADLSELRRIETAAKAGTLDQGVLNEARHRYEGGLAGEQVAESAVEAAKANLTLAEAKLRAAQANAETAAARTEVARKELEELAAWIGYASLRAPFRGVVTTRGVDVGDLVGGTHKAAGESPLFTVCHLDKLRIRVPIPERDAPLVNAGDAAEFRSEAFPGQVFSGRVSRLASGLDTHTRTMLVEVDLPNPDRRLLPGMFGQVALVLDERPDRLVLPASAVQHEKGGGSYAYIVDGDSRVRRVAMTTGFDDGRRIEIVKGLTGHEQVVLIPTSQITPGQAVRVTTR
jgi:RND family efflux transporter MFP subunit